VLSPWAYNAKVGLALLCPITAQLKGYPFEVRIPEGLRIGGVVLSDHVKSLEWKARNAQFICALPNEVLGEVLAKLNALLQP